MSVCLFTFLKISFFKFDSEKFQLRGKILFNILKLYIIVKKCNFCAFGYYYRKLLKCLTSDYIGTYCPTVLSVILIDTFLKEAQIGLMTGNWKRPQNLDAHSLYLRSKECQKADQMSFLIKRMWNRALGRKVTHKALNVTSKTLGLNLSLCSLLFFWP